VARPHTIEGLVEGLERAVRRQIPGHPPPKHEADPKAGPVTSDLGEETVR
jgi:hypothetical protein